MRRATNDKTQKQVVAATRSGGLKLPPDGVVYDKRQLI